MNAAIKSALLGACMAALAAGASADDKSAAQAPLWRLSPDVSFSTFGLGFEPVNASIQAINLLGVAGGGWLKLGYGLYLDDDYYLLVPERETAVRLSAGYARYGSGGTSSALFGGVEESAGYRDFALGYVDVGLDQVLAGDRRHADSWLLASLSNESRFVAPSAAAGEATAPEAFLAHRPRAGLAFRIGPRDAFWAIASLSGSAGAQVEAGSSASRTPWAFAAADAALSFSLPIAGRWLFLSATGRGSAVIAGLASLEDLPAYYYASYASGASVGLDADLRSRVLVFDPMVPMALDLCVGLGSTAEGPDLGGLDAARLARPVLRAYARLSVETVIAASLRLDAGLGYDPSTGSFWPIFGVSTE